MNCIACKADLCEGATICSACGQYQAKWKNNLRYFGALAGLITVVFGGLVFVLDKSPDAWQSVFGKDDIRVLSFANILKTSIANIGRGPVFVESIEVKSDLATAIMLLNSTIQPSEVYVEDNSERPDFSRIQGIATAQWDHLRNSPCFEVGHFDRDNAFLREARTKFPDAEEAFGTATVRFISLDSGNQLEKVFDSASILITYKDCKPQTQPAEEN